MKKSHPVGFFVCAVVDCPATLHAPEKKENENEKDQRTKKGEKTRLRHKNDPNLGQKSANGTKNSYRTRLKNHWS